MFGVILLATGSFLLLCVLIVAACALHEHRRGRGGDWVPWSD